MNILVVGAGKVGYFLAKRLFLEKHTVTVVEKEHSVCEDLAKELDILVVSGDGCDPRILEEAGINITNVVAAVTGDDEDNLIICQLAKERFNVKRAIARVNNPDNEHIFAALGIDSPVDSTRIIAKIIEEEISFADFVNLMTFKRGKLAIIRIDLPEESPVLNKQVKDIELPKDSVLVSLVRGEEVIVPRGDTVLKSGDDIIALTRIGNESQLLRVLVGTL